MPELRPVRPGPHIKSIPDATGYSDSNTKGMYLSKSCTGTDTKNGHPGCYDKGCVCWCHQDFVAGLFGDLNPESEAGT